MFYSTWPFFFGLFRKTSKKATTSSSTTTTTTSTSDKVCSTTNLKLYWKTHLLNQSLHVYNSVYTKIEIYSTKIQFPKCNYLCWCISTVKLKSEYEELVILVQRITRTVSVLTINFSQRTSRSKIIPVHVLIIKLSQQSFQ